MSSYLTPTPKRQVLVLTMTEQCNLRCSYCYESKSPEQLLPSEIAQKAIIEAFENDGFDELEINFFGGEPLLAFKEISIICEWVWSREWRKPYIFFASTNGTLVHGDVKNWFIKNKDRFILGLSLDGTPEMHDANRTGSYSQIDLPTFKELWPFQSVKMTVSRETVGSLSDGVIHIHDMGFKVACNHAFGIDWQPSDYPIFSRELKKLADYYLAHPEVEPCNLMSMPVEAASLDHKPSKFCGTGTSLSCIDKTGKKYPCQTFMPMSAGKSIDADEMFEKLSNPDNYNDLRCSECCLQPICPTCYGTNFNRSGDPFVRDISDCTFSKIRAKANSYMQTQMILHRDRGYSYLASKSDADLYRMIGGIKLIHQSLTIKSFTWDHEHSPASVQSGSNKPIAVSKEPLLVSAVP